MLTTDEIFQKINSTLTIKKANEINSSYLFNIGENNTEQWLIDLTKQSNWITKVTDHHNAQCVIIIKDINVLKDIVSGKINPTIAFMQEKIKIKGDISLALRLQKLFP